MVYNFEILLSDYEIKYSNAHRNTKLYYNSKYNNTHLTVYRK